MAVAKLFWDTNIVLDLLDQRPHELSETIELFRQANDGDLDLFVSESVITNCLSVSKHANAVVVLQAFLDVAAVLPVTMPLIKAALNSSFKDKEDAILYHLAAHHQIDAFITRNKKDFAGHNRKSTPVMTPKEFLKKRK